MFKIRNNIRKIHVNAFESLQCLTKLNLKSNKIDFIEELRLRRWARENFVPPERRERSWHPIVHDEMKRKDLEAARPAAAPVA